MFTSVNVTCYSCFNAAGAATSESIIMDKISKSLVYSALVTVCALLWSGVIIAWTIYHG